MHSYTSSSDTRSWIKAWVVGVILFVTVIAALELFWRSEGYSPDIVDDLQLWSEQRRMAGKSASEVVLLGSSRMLTNFSIPEYKKISPESTVINLAVDGACANLAIKDLADEKSFNGLIVAEMTSECVIFGEGAELGVGEHIEYYKRRDHLDARLNRDIATFFQERLALIDPYLNLAKVAGSLVFKGELRPQKYWSTTRDRSQFMDYSKLDIDKYRAKRLRKLKKYYQGLAPEISQVTFLSNAHKLEQAVKKIQSRGGGVIFIRFPVSNEHWQLDEEYFPRKEYWNLLARNTSAATVHFKDNKRLGSFNFPDSSHLDMHDKAAFTKVLYDEVISERQGP